jgi:predicted GNAT family acetyltransferase
VRSRTKREIRGEWGLASGLGYVEYQDAAGFLGTARAALEREESLNALMLGIALRLVREPRAYGGDPYLATVESARGLKVAAVMTPPYRLQIFSTSPGESAVLERLAEGLVEGGWRVPGVLAQEALAEVFTSVWAARTGATPRIGMRQTVYELREVVPPCLPPGGLKQAGPEDLGLVRDWARAFHRDCLGDGREEQSVAGAVEKVKTGGLFFWVDGVPRSVAGRVRPTPHGEAVSFVYTPPAERRKGYGAAVAAGVSQRILDDGKDFCTLFANAANPTSNGVYRRIGYRPIADVMEVDFADRNGDLTARASA